MNFSTPHGRRLATAAVWVGLLVAAIALLLHSKDIGISKSFATVLSLIFLWAATLFPNCVDARGIISGASPATSLWRRRVRRVLALLFAATGAAAAVLMRPKVPGEGEWLTLLMGAGLFGLLGYVIGDQILPSLMRRHLSASGGA